MAMWYDQICGIHIPTVKFHKAYEAYEYWQVLCNEVFLQRTPVLYVTVMVRWSEPEENPGRMPPAWRYLINRPTVTRNIANGQYPLRNRNEIKIGALMPGDSVNEATIMCFQCEIQRAYLIETKSLRDFNNFAECYKEIRSVSILRTKQHKHIMLIQIPRRRNCISKIQH